MFHISFEHFPRNTTQHTVHLLALALYLSKKKTLSLPHICIIFSLCLPNFRYHLYTHERTHPGHS